MERIHSVYAEVVPAATPKNASGVCLRICQVSDGAVLSSTQHENVAEAQAAKGAKLEQYKLVPEGE